MITTSPTLKLVPASGTCQHVSVIDRKGNKITCRNKGYVKFGQHGPTLCREHAQKEMEAAF